MLHFIVITSYYISTIPSFASESDALDVKNLSFKDVDVDFLDLPASVVISGDNSPAPVEKSEWIEGTGNKDKPDAPNTDVNINKLSGEGTDEDGYMFAERSDHPPIAIVDFDPNDFFPKEARSANIPHKTVVLKLQINEDGSIRSARITSPPSGFGFDDAALKVMKKLRFRPGRVKGRAVKMLIPYAIRFEQID